MRIFTAIIFSVLVSVSAIAQQKPVEKKQVMKKPKIFRSFYFNFGINLPQENFGQSPLLTNNAKQNILAGYYGAKKPGYLFEFGSKIYFNGSDHKFRFGLDWTFLSANYNEMDWTAYAAAKGGVVTEPRVFSLSSKLGPVFSYNIVKKLVVDARFQAAAVAHYSTFEYGGRTASAEDFIFTTDKVSDFYGGIKLNAGVGIRWGVIGLGADYFTGKLNTAYQYDNAATGEHSSTNGTLKEKIKSSSIQVKLSLYL